MDPRTRKSVADLDVADLLAWPAWQYALDEEDVEGQDEATVRPFAFTSAVDPSEGGLLVRARFRFADGTDGLGTMSPRVAPDDVTHPAVITPRGLVGFWLGRIEKRQVAKSLAAEYAKLGKPAAETFPLRLTSDVPLVGGAQAEELAGFSIVESVVPWRVRVVS